MRDEQGNGRGAEDGQCQPNRRTDERKRMRSHQCARGQLRSRMPIGSNAELRYSTHPGGVAAECTADGSSFNHASNKQRCLDLLPLRVAWTAGGRRPALTGWHPCPTTPQRKPVCAQCCQDIPAPTSCTTSATSSLSFFTIVTAVLFLASLLLPCQAGFLAAVWGDSAAKLAQ